MPHHKFFREAFKHHALGSNYINLYLEFPLVSHVSKKKYHKKTSNEQISVGKGPKPMKKTRSEVLIKIIIQMEEKRLHNTYTVSDNSEEKEGRSGAKTTSTYENSP